MPNDSQMVKNVTFIFVVRRIKTLGVAITIGIIVVYLLGLLVASNNTVENFEIVNIISLILLAAAVPFSIFIKNNFLKKVDINNFTEKYFNAYIIPFCVIDFAALLCITTNLFVNGNIFYASIGAAIGVAGMLMNFPREDFFDSIKHSTLQEINISKEQPK